MMGPQDLGGRSGFGPVPIETEEPLFHADWEKRALGMTLCCGALGYWGIDASRHARESLSPQVYYSSSYYAIWIRALTNLLLEHGEVTPAELAAGRALGPGLRTDRCLPADKVPDVLSKGGPADRPATADPKFAIGDLVRTVRDDPPGHTRLPGYARGRVGEIAKIHGCHVFPDAAAHGKGEQPAWLYTVVFDGKELWGRSAEPGIKVSIEAWEPYLAPAAD
ncbi:MAG: nitrile hydratase subunit beta [Pseudomonadota bacterium]